MITVVIVAVVHMTRTEGTVGGMTVGTPGGEGRNRMLAVAVATVADMVVDRTGTTVVDLITFATHS